MNSEMAYLTSSTKCPFNSKPLLPISNNKVRIKVSVIFSIWEGVRVRVREGRGGEVTLRRESLHLFIFLTNPVIL